MTEPSDPAATPQNPTETSGPAPSSPYGTGTPPPGYPPNYAAGPYPGTYPPPPTPGGYPPAPPQPYAGYGAPMPAAPKNGLGIAALILGLLSLPAVFSVVGGFALGILAVILGFVGYRRARSGAATNGGMAIAGVVLGILGIIVSAVMIAVGVWGFNTFGGRDLMDCLRDAGNDTSAQQQCQEEFRGNLENQLSITLTPTP